MTYSDEESQSTHLQLGEDSYWEFKEVCFRWITG